MKSTTCSILAAIVTAALSPGPALSADPEPGRGLAEPPELAGADGGTGAKVALNLAVMPFTRESVRKVVSNHQGKIAACYEEALANREKTLEGKILVAFVITPEGLVKNASVRKKGTTLQDAELHDCVVSVVTAMNFPKPPDGRDHPIEYPFNLKANR